MFQQLAFAVNRLLCHMEAAHQLHTTLPQTLLELLRQNAFVSGLFLFVAGALPKGLQLQLLRFVDLTRLY